WNEFRRQIMVERTCSTRALGGGPTRPKVCRATTSKSTKSVDSADSFKSSTTARRDLRKVERPERASSRPASHGQEHVLATFQSNLFAITACCGLAYSGLVTAVAEAQVFSKVEEPFLLRSLTARAQEADAPETESRDEPENPFEEHLETDRDSFTPATTTVNKNRWILESSYSFIDNR